MEPSFFPTKKTMDLEKLSILLVLLIPIVLFLTKKPSKKLPPGSMGLPFVGHSLSLLRAMRANKGDAWLRKRIEKYGPVSKFNLFGTPTIFLFNQMMEGMLSVPVNLPFTRFNRSQDLITCLLNSRREGDAAALSDNEILDNVSIVMIAGHDTTSILLTSLIRLFALKPSIYTMVAQEQEEVSKTKPSGELLTWDDLVKMKYTWRVAMETLRMIPPAFVSFRQAVRDIEYEGYIIPKGWQVVWSSTMTHMDEEIFKDPTKFDEKRFEQQPPPYSFVAFGGGPRICPGYEFAKIETLVMIHYLVTRFTWQLATDDSSFARDPLPVFKQDLPIRIAPKTL